MKENMEEQKLYDIVASDGAILPRHYSGRGRTLEEANKMLKGLNNIGEYRPYTLKVIGHER